METTNSKPQQEGDFELFFEPDELPRIQYLLETKQFLGLSRLKSFIKDNTGTKLQLSLTHGGKRATVQLFEYFIRAYIPVSPLMEFQNVEAEALSVSILS